MHFIVLLKLWVNELGVSDRCQSYPLVSLMMSPGWMRLPSSSQTEIAMLPVLSATLHERTSCPSFVLVTRPDRNKTKMNVKFKQLIDRNFRKCNFVSGPFKDTEVDGMRTPSTPWGHGPTTYRSPVRWIRYSNFSTRASRLLSKLKPRLWGWPLLISGKNIYIYINIAPPFDL